MKVRLSILFIAMVMALSACGSKQAESPDKDVDNTYVGENSGPTETETDAERFPVIDETVVAENNAVVSAMLDCFRDLDYDGALEYIIESDRENLTPYFESANEEVIYPLLLSNMSYELGDSLTDEQGRRYVRTKISAPSMLDIYGEVVLLMNDAVMSGEVTSNEELREFNNQAFIDVVDKNTVGTSTLEVDVELQIDADSALRVAFTTEILNAMLGDIQNAGQQVGDALNEGMEEYVNARNAGAFE